MNRYIITVCCIAVIALCSSFTTGKEIYRDSSKPVDERVNDLLDRMNIEQMIGQLNLVPYYESNDSTVRGMIREGRVGALLKANGAQLNLSLQHEAVESSPFGIPLMFHEDVIHGYRTIAPIPLAEACSWNRELVGRTAAMAAREASSAGLQLTYAPMVDVSTDPRWGRIMETSGEDSYLCAELAKARVEGFQGSSFAHHDRIAACVKHFAGYAALTAGRDYQNTNFSSRDLEEIYLPPYKAAIEAGVGSVMCSYTAFDGIPATHSHYLNTQVLRDELGFEGLLMTDWCTLSHAVAEGASNDQYDSALKGIESGIEMDMSSGYFDRTLAKLVAEGKVSKQTIRNAAFHALKLKFEAGLFDNPYGRFDTKREQSELLSEKNRATALEAATQSMVLLKNNNALPLSTTESIVVVGPYCSEREALMGSWTARGRKEEIVTMGEAIKGEFEGCTIDTLPCQMDKITDTYIARATIKAASCDVAVVCLGEPASLIGEGVSTANIALPDDQLRLLGAIRKVNDRVVVVMFNGRPLATDAILDSCDALLEAWYPGTMGAMAAAQLLSGKSNPSGRLCQTFPRSAGQIPIFYNSRRTFANVDHADTESGPQFPFGWGLSYSDYRYSNLSLSANQYKRGDKLTVSVEVENTSDRQGRETIQLYIARLTASIIPHTKELRGFKQVVIAPRSRVKVEIELDDSSFEIFDSSHHWSVESGKAIIMVGHDSESLMKAELTIL